MRRDLAFSSAKIRSDWHEVCYNYGRRTFPLPGNGAFAVADPWSGDFFCQDAMANSEKARGDETFLTPPLRTLLLVLLTLVVCYAARGILLPFALAVLLSFLLTPLATKLQRAGLGRIGGVIVTVVFAFLLFGGVGYIVVRQTLSVVADLPKYEETLINKIRTVRQSSPPTISGAAKTMERIEKEIVQPNEENQAPKESTFSLRDTLLGEDPLPVQIVDTAFAPVRVMNELSPLFTLLGSVAIVVVFVIFILLERERLRDRVIRLVGASRVYVTTQALEDAATRVSRYLLMQLLINSMYGAAVGAGMYFIGLPNAVLWGLLATILRFLPYVGPIIAACTPIALSLAVFEGWERPLMTIALFIVAELITNNVLEPWLYGSSVGVSTLAIVFAAVFWTWLWGPVGLVLATPLTVCMTVMARHIPQLAFLNILLADEPPLELKFRFYQRLLAQDYEDASDVAREFLRGGSLEELWEGMFVPALFLAERDRDAGRLSRKQESFIFESIDELIDEMQEEFAMSSAGAVPEIEEGTPLDDVAQETREVQPRRVLCLGLEDEADRIAGRMFAQLLSARGYLAEIMDANGASEALMERLDEAPVEALAISAVSPGGSVRLRAVCRKLRRRAPGAKILVGLWHAPQRLERMIKPLEKAGADLLCSSYKSAFKILDEAVPPAPAQERLAPSAESETRKRNDPAEENADPRGGRNPARAPAGPG
jgi:predicted PurR-regulated permease PerM